jgi:hypothetical protein
MRDIIWTIIVVWVVWRIIDAFRSFSHKTSRVNTHSNRTYTDQSHGNHQESSKKGHLKPDAGEYVDYEETK